MLIARCSTDANPSLKIFLSCRPMTFTGSQLASVLLVLGLVNIPQHPNLGCRLNAIALLIFTAVLGPVLNGTVVRISHTHTHQNLHQPLTCLHNCVNLRLQASVAQSCGGGRLGVLIALSLLSLVPLTAVRVMPGPPATSLMPCLAVGFGIIGIDTGLPYASLWHNVRSSSGNACRMMHVFLVLWFTDNLLSGCRHFGISQGALITVSWHQFESILLSVSSSVTHHIIMHFKDQIWRM